MEQRRHRKREKSKEKKESHFFPLSSQKRSRKNPKQRTSISEPLDRLPRITVKQKKNTFSRPPSASVAAGSSGGALMSSSSASAASASAAACLRARARRLSVPFSALPFSVSFLYRNRKPHLNSEKKKPLSWKKKKEDSLLCVSNKGKQERKFVFRPLDEQAIQNLALNHNPMRLDRDSNSRLSLPF